MASQQDSTGTPAADVRVYRLAPALVARMVGSLLVVTALLVFALTGLVFALGWSPDLIVVLLALGLAAVFTLGWWLRSRAWALRLDDEGYAVRLVRGARVRRAGWAEVREVATASPRDIACLVLRLRDGRETYVPVEALQGDREELVREVQRRLKRARPRG